MTNLEDSFPKKLHTIIKVDLDDLKKLDDLVDKVNAKEQHRNELLKLVAEYQVKMIKASHLQAKLIEKIVQSLRRADK